MSKSEFAPIRIREDGQVEIVDAPNDTSTMVGAIISDTAKRAQPFDLSEVRWSFDALDGNGRRD
ncbi:hypothetical protein HYZ99_05010 [Candidatus Peregrinibacteria bacterium]|nr:hypothetical protein [Candidatus Peregrinibacteria bacterium]